ncbi:MAG: hypothetical protein H6R10_3357 [Rhodocyclaceae bacterium]|nr:hypothetical protein [Rhodocyclaceae bacterium]
MNKKLSLAAFLLGLVAVGWVGAGYIGASPLALAMTMVIGAVYGAGALELRRFHRATSTLAQALAAIPENLADLGDWLGQLHPSLRNPVRLRIEGERIALPGPAMTPYLVGLLVLLGMLGTFLGMVVTLNGAVIALESTTDLQTIRAALAAPVKGLGVAFGTSVAGVAASAMLGLISALCRRERLQAGQLLDTRIATVLRGFSLAHQRQETFKALQSQSQALPEVVEKLQAMMAQMERQGQQLNERLLANQESFYREARGVYSDLASSVGQSLRESLTESARLAGSTIQPIVEATMTGIAKETTSLHGKMADTVRMQLDGLSERFGATVDAVADTWAGALARHERTTENLTRDMGSALESFAATFEQRSASLLAAVQENHSAVLTDLAARDQQRQAAMTGSLESMAAALQREWQQAGAQVLGQQQQICATLDETARNIVARAEAQASSTIGEVTRLMEAAAEAPRAAAEVIGQLRQELSNSIARDNELLAERSRIMETLGALLDAINHASREQRGAIDALVASSAALLDRAGAEFKERIEAESGKMAAAATQITGSAVEVSSLGEAFGFAVQLFTESNDKLVAHLQRIEGALGKSMARSDDQLAYYVAQAREIIDLSLMSQQRIVEDLQQMAGKPVASEVC